MKLFYYSLLALLVAGIASAKPVKEVQIVSKEAGIDLSTSKVSYILPTIDENAVTTYSQSIKDTAHIPGDRIIVIRSQGGSVSAGANIMLLMEIEKMMGTRLVCVVDGITHSMAFNLLTHCDVKLATKASIMVVHKIRVPWLPPGAWTAVQLFEERKYLDGYVEISKHVVWK